MRIGKVAYAMLFGVALPAALAAWAIRLDHLIKLPPIGSRAIGIALGAAGAILISAAVIALRRFGNGWPMSPYPPERRVERGPYGIIENPIYFGSVLAVAGAAVAFRSPSGIWIITPFLAFACLAFVIGYERDATTRRFGAPSAPPLLRVSRLSDDAPRIEDRISILLLVLLPWFLVFAAVSLLGVPADARSGWSRWDAFVPMLPATELIYFATYPFVLAFAFVAQTRRQLREFALQGWIATIAVTLFYLVVPVAVAPKPAPLDSVFTTLMLWERAFDAPATSFPAFHVIWAFIAAAAYARALPRLRMLWWTMAITISISCATTGMHSVADVIAGVIASILILRSAQLGRIVIHATERLANSWREWDLGVIRFMSHGLYAAAGSFCGVLIVSMLMGAPTFSVLAVGAAIIIGSAIWAQWIEGSPQLLRPFGYYGGVIACCLAVPFTAEPLRLLAAYSVAATVIQAFGRCRCLVQGCCHGRAAPEEIGIRYDHPRSRVTRLSALATQSLHATQLYSIACNVIMFVILLRLWMIHAPLSFIAGTYLILGGLSRFVEEHFRGEPQTPVVGGLRAYQWLSIGSVVAGALVTCIRSAPATPAAPIDASMMVAAAIFAVATYVAYGVDFPRLSVRFARLV